MCHVLLVVSEGKTLTFFVLVQTRIRTRERPKGIAPSRFTTSMTTTGIGLGPLSLLKSISLRILRVFLSFWSHRRSLFARSQLLLHRAFFSRSDSSFIRYAAGTKRPRLPALVCRDSEIVEKFAKWCFKCLECDEIVVLDKNQRSVEYEKGKWVRFVSGNDRYVEELKAGRVDSQASTKELPERFETPKVDLLILCGTEFVGEFPAFALRACEIHIVSKAFSVVEFAYVLQRFAKSQQRLGA